MNIEEFERLMIEYGQKIIFPGLIWENRKNIIAFYHKKADCNKKQKVFSYSCTITREKNEDRQINYL